MSRHRALGKPYKCLSSPKNLGASRYLTIFTKGRPAHVIGNIFEQATWCPVLLGKGLKKKQTMKRAGSGGLLGIFREATNPHTL